ncbi:MAG: hypothetical protein LUQ59_03740 [Methanothrix sp.]|nr:hypothetical protein [Methanothrix sp.]
MIINVTRTIILMGLAILLLQPTGTCLSVPLQDSMLPLDPMQEDTGVDAQGVPFNDEPVDVLHSGSGAAILDNGSHPFWLSIVSAKTIEPKKMRNMLTSNQSLDEIREALGATEVESRFDGAIKLDESIYSLGSIKMLQYDENSSTLDAYVIEPGISHDVGYETTIVGKLALNIIGSGADLLAEGELLLYRGPQAASYRIFLDMQPPR